MLVVLAFALTGRMNRIEGGAPGGFSSPHIHLEEIRIDQGGHTTEVTIRRKKVFVPQEYGRLVAVTSHRGGAMLWFAEGDTIRNVVVKSRDVIVRRGGDLVQK